jgi:methyl-accepting chemotaxis protein
MSGSSVASRQSPDSRTRTDLGSIADVCERAAAGDLEARIVDVDADGDLGRLCRAINAMLDVADSFVREAAAAMEECSHDRFHRPILLRGLRGAYRKSAAVINAAGTKMRDSREQIRFVGRLAAENAESVTTVAAACRELSASSTEISRLTADSARLTQSAVGEVALATEAVGAMNDAMRRVDGILALIVKVAEQTNLLALNATIEAARAAEHGKGFAVVATEVKELARSTGDATGEIAQQVERMQGAAQRVALSIQGIHRSVSQIDDGAVAVARALAEEAVATADIDRMITEVSENTNRVSTRIGGVRAARARA